MKRRFMMWMTIVCIFVVGVLITRMTQSFVMSQSVETAAFLNVENTGDVEETAIILLEETSAETIAEATIQKTIEEIAPISVTEELAEAVPKAPIDTTINEAIQETVKSPLDPIVAKDTMIEDREEQDSYQVKDFFERFAHAEQNALQIWENVTSDNRSAYLAAAEQERSLWDYELNHVSQIIRERLSKEEIEELKILEVEWIRERDLYAEKAGAKGNIKAVQSQNPDYTRALAEKTKERCYWLVSEYEDLLNQD